MANSINTSAGALIALQNLRSVQAALSTTQNRINTGLKVASAKDNGATWAIAQNQRSSISDLDSVKDSILRQQSTVDVAVSAAETVSDLLNQMKAKALAASDASLDGASRDALSSDITALRAQINRTIDNAQFNGVNLLKTGATALFAMTNAADTIGVTLSAGPIIVGPPVTSFTGTVSFISFFYGSFQVDALANQIQHVNAVVAQLGTQANTLTTQLNFTSKLQDTLTIGVGNLVDADVAKESANLTALQAKRQLGVRALSIANASSSSLLRLFGKQSAHGSG